MGNSILASLGSSPYGSRTLDLVLTSAGLEFHVNIEYSAFRQAATQFLVGAATGQMLSFFLYIYIPMTFDFP